MCPSLLTILTHRQITLPVLIEDENHREFPSIHHLFRPLRQNVYAILFNLHHHTFMAKRTQKGLLIHQFFYPLTLSLQTIYFCRR